jgi:hypothetical protein
MNLYSNLFRFTIKKIICRYTSQLYKVLKKKVLVLITETKTLEQHSKFIKTVNNLQHKIF